MTRKLLLYIIFLIVSLWSARSQEVVTGLQINPVLKNRISEKAAVKGITADTLELPFFDDFSDNGIFPDTRKWSDGFVFINNTYSDRQITTGIATFDALSSDGRLYESASPAGFGADHLTSLPLNLSFPASDSIRLSFFYQPGGLADFPEADDSLTLQFFAPQEDKWHSVWKAAGNTNPGFTDVMVAIEHSRFLKKGFRFRFVNYASLSENPGDPSIAGNCDQWNIDYVLLDRNRHSDDTVYHDVAFRYPFRSLLSKHEAMPWKQFRQVYLQEMGSVIPIHYRNNDTIIRNVTRNFTVWDIHNNTQAHFFSAGAANVSPLTNVDYDANLIYTFDTDNDDSALFRITGWLITDDFDPKENDTVVYFQKFSNYFAVDDGSSEAGYGINGQGSRNAMVAYWFKSFMKDTLRAISICFNDSYLNANQRTFDLMVWSDDNGVPGDVLFTDEEVMVEQGNDINGFYMYVLPEGLMVNSSFFVGWKQRSETFLNAGLDVNTPHGGKQYYWLNGSWNQSLVKGSIMIRPVVGAPLTTSINDVRYRYVDRIRLWPNPAKEFITVDIGEYPDTELVYVMVTDLQGRELLKVPYSDRIDISSLHEGIYIVNTSYNGRMTGYNRLVKIK